MTVIRVRVKSGTVATQTTGTDSRQSKTPSKKPDRPRVDIGPKSYKAKKSGKRIVIRFCVGTPAVLDNGPPWFVYDSATGQRAARTSPDGYQSYKEAVSTARTYRDKYGAYTVMDF